MKTDIARTVATIAIWAAVAIVPTNIHINGPQEMIVQVFVGMTALLSTAAAAGTFAVWRSPRAAESPKEIHREL